MSRIWLVGTLALLVACAPLSPEEKLRQEFMLDVYWDAAHDCEGKHRTLHVEGVQMDGDLSLRADADSRIDAAAFRECYRDGIRDRVERRRQAGLPVPETVNMNPDIDID
jgi:hypothetical protein